MGRLTPALTVAQAAALARLSPHLESSYYLAGGVAVALKFRHRQSKDLDIFTAEGDPLILAGELSRLKHVRVISEAKTTLHLEVEGVPVSLLRYVHPLIAERVRYENLPISAASVEDLIAMKLLAIANRGAARDFWDLHTMILEEKRDLASALLLFEEKFKAHDAGHVVRALAYFDDAEAEPMPAGLTSSVWKDIRRDFEQWVVSLD